MAVARVAGLVGEHLTEWQADEYKSVKQQLLKLEDHGSGRVRLADFYGQALHGGTWQLSESLPYLRELGALDETKPGNPRVVISNYLLGASNCIATSASLSVCDRSECEAVLGHLERTVGAPEATPQELVSLVSGLSTATVPGNRTISLVMRHRLNSMASANGGRVALHGRLFAQWLHHAYPRECPFPHLSGTTKPQNTEDWLRSTGTDYVASPKDMARHAGTSPQSPQLRARPGPIEMAAWSYKEELFVPRPLAAEGSPMALAAVHGMVFAAAAAVALGLLLARTAGAARRAAAAVRAQGRPGEAKPYLV